MNDQLHSSPTVIVNDTSVVVEVAATEDAITRGLSGRAMLKPERGMLFLFSKPALYRFWMRDMRFPIDIIWIASGQVVSVNANVGTQFDAIVPLRQSFLRWLMRRRRPLFYSPMQPAQYALEVNAGFAAQHHIVPGSDVSFQNVTLPA